MAEPKNHINCFLNLLEKFNHLYPTIKNEKDKSHESKIAGIFDISLESVTIISSIPR